MGEHCALSRGRTDLAEHPEIHLVVNMVTMVVIRWMIIPDAASAHRGAILPAFHVEERKEGSIEIVELDDNVSVQKECPPSSPRSTSID